MKKMLLLFFSTINFALFAASPYISLYIDCGNGPVLYNPIPMPMYSNSGYIEAFFNNITICENCKISYKITGSMAGHDEIFTYNNNSRVYFDNGDYEIFNYTADFSAFSSKSITAIYTAGTSGNNGFPGVMIHFNNLKILTPDSKNNISMDSKQVCKGTCLRMDEIINFRSPDGTPKADVGNFVINGASDCDLIGGTPQHPNFNNDNICFNELGTFSICAKVKDACGIKELRAVYKVVECDENGDEVTDCTRCCDAIISKLSSIKSKGFSVFSDIYILDFNELGLLCGDIRIEMELADGSSIGINSTILESLNGVVKTSSKPVKITITSIGNCSCGFSIVL